MRIAKKLKKITIILYLKSIQFNCTLSLQTVFQQKSLDSERNC